MNSRIAKLALLVFVLCCGTAWDRAQATGAQDCCSLVGACAGMKDNEILAAAFLPAQGVPTHLGMCYYHDRSTCPNCSFEFYVKESYLPPPSGYDGGNGGVSGTLADVARILRQLCQSGACCCPQKPAGNGCSSLGTTVWAKDPVTKTCCQYSNSCLAPTGWQQYSSQTDCSGVTPSF